MISPKEGNLGRYSVNELSLFWNPTEDWVLPTVCENHGCQAVISAETISGSPNEDGCVTITCSSCYHTFDYVVRRARGDPRNIAFVGHWDGFEMSQSARGHGCGTID